ncbi:MAG: pesticin C-terminus-like muramidase [Candidatus Methylumidiphilus sp.]
MKKASEAIKAIKPTKASKAIKATKASKAKSPPATQSQPLTADELEKLKPEVKAWEDALKTMTPAEQDEVINAANRIRPGAISNGVYQPCPNEKKAKRVNCVKPSGEVGMSDAAKQKILADAQKETGNTMRANIGKLVEWEGNYSGAYVPWGPEFVQKEVDVGTRKVKVLSPATDRDRGTLKGWNVGNYKNNSGVTVGMGVDLGAKSESEIENLVNKGAKGTGLLTEEQAKSLQDRLKPYAGKKRSEACQYLRMHPLTLNQSELDVLNYSSVKSNLITASNQYGNKTGKSFGDLGEEEQTLVLSKVYHTGSIQKKLATSLSEEDLEGVLKQLKGSREYSYFKSYYDSLPEEE